MAIIVAFLTKLVVMKLWGLIALPLAGWILGEVRWLAWQAIVGAFHHLLGHRVLVPMVPRRPALWISGRTAELLRVKPTPEPYHRIVDKHPMN